MKLSLMPDKYRELTEDELTARIRKIKTELGSQLVILVHHYQRREIVELGDFAGDSLGLSQTASRANARFIVFCGVHFMAESAAVLAGEGQAVFIPDLAAGCPMADMAPAELVERAWREISEVLDPDRLTPVTYVNSSAAVKAFCGRNRGATCTSSNADKVMAWALDRGDQVLFLPDEHLGRNTAARLGIGPVRLWDSSQPLGGLTPDEVKAGRVLVWNGFCHVHTHFSVEQIQQKREEFPGCRVVVHPECRQEVVQAADASGSTEGIIKYVAEQPRGAVIAVGTEIHLVERLMEKYRGQKTVAPLARSLCPNMYRIGLPNLDWILDKICDGPTNWVNRVTVSEDVKRDAAQALTRMLAITG